MSKKRLDELGVSAFCESMAMMIQAGIQTDEAVALLQSENRDGGMLEQSLSEMKTPIEQGSGLAEAMKSVEIFPDFAVRMIAAGESSGRLEDVLFRLARYYAEQKTISEKLKNAVTYPAAMLVLIIAVLAVMLTGVMPAMAEGADPATEEGYTATGEGWTSVVSWCAREDMKIYGKFYYPEGFDESKTWPTVIIRLQLNSINASRTNPDRRGRHSITTPHAFPPSGPEVAFLIFSRSRVLRFF